MLRFSCETISFLTGKLAMFALLCTPILEEVDGMKISLLRMIDEHDVFLADLVL